MSAQYNNRSLLNHIRNGLIWATTGFVASTLATFAHISYLSHNLKPAELGVYFIFFSTAMLISTLAGLGLPEALIKYIAKAHRTEEKLAARTILVVNRLINTSTTALIALLFLIGEHTLFVAFDIEWNITHLTLLCTWFALLTKQSIQSSRFRSIHNIKKSTFFGNTLRNTLYFLITITVTKYFGKLDLTLALYSVVAAVLLNNITAYVFRSKVFNYSGHKNFNFRTELDILKLSTPLLANLLIQIIVARIGIWSLGYYSPKETVATYGAAVQFSALITMPLLVINTFTMPLIADMYHNDPDKKKLQRVLRSLTTVAVIPVFFMYIFLVIFGESLLAFFFGEPYRAGYWILILLATGQLTNLMAGPCGLLLKMTNHHNLLLKINLIFVTFAVIATIAITPYFGAIGVATVAMFAFALQNIVSLYVAVSKTGINTATLIKPVNLVSLYNDLSLSFTKKRH